MKYTESRYIAIVIALFVGAFILYTVTVNSDKKEITEWVNARSEEVITIEGRSMNIGPYWHCKNTRFYYVKTDRNVYWFKYAWGRTINREIGDGKYVEIE